VSPEQPPVGPLRLTQIRATTAGQADQARGVMAFVSFVLSGVVRIDGLTIRRTGDESYYLAYPGRRDKHGVVHSVVAPVDDDVRLEIEAQVFAALRLVQVP
jgi:DNA-binding cell septation regulator SpoVG